MKTKGWLLIFSIIIALGWGCKQKELDTLKGENSKLIAETMQKDSTITLLFQAFNEIEENLELIKAKQSVISGQTKGNPELNSDVRSRINDDIQAINDLMDKNKRMIANMKKKLKDANLKIAEFERVVERLNKQVEEKDVEINGLKDQLVKMNFKVEELNARIDTINQESEKKSEVIASKTAELNTAWFVYGTKKELISKGIIAKTGGVLGIGTNKKVSDEIDKSYLTKVDITRLNEIPLNVKSAKIQTVHPSSSYSLQKEGKMITKLVITDNKRFWESSKLLVIIVE